MATQGSLEITKGTQIIAKVKGEDKKEIWDLA